MMVACLLISIRAVGLMLPLLIFFISCCTTPATAEEVAKTQCNPYFHNEEAVARSVKKATKMLEKFENSKVPMSDRVVVNILFSRGFLHGHNFQHRLQFLKCALLKLKINLMDKTPTDIFIWTLNTENVHPVIPDWINSELLPRVHVIEIEPETWQVPCGLKPDSEWVTRDKFDVDYYMMGRWRLSFSLDFAKAMGYGYHLQFDDDAMLNAKLDYDVVESLKKKDIHMGVFSDHIGEVAHVTLGLPEITRYWMTIRNFQPKGELFKHVNPHDMNGVTSAGWDRYYHPGYFLMVKVDFWFQEHIQDYLTTIFRSGRDIEGRWQEQAVMNMMRLVFVAPANLLVMEDVDIGHDRHNRKNFEAWCINTGIISADESGKRLRA